MEDAWNAIHPPVETDTQFLSEQAQIDILGVTCDSRLNTFRPTDLETATDDPNAKRIDYIFTSQAVIEEAKVAFTERIPAQDTAIIKVEATDMPFLKLATASSIKVQDTVTAVAYPGDADTGDFTSLFSPTSTNVNTVNSLLSVSVNSGQVTAQKTFADGTLVYETSGISSAGSSGGPVLDEKGAIIGFVDAGPTNDRITLLVPSSVVTSYKQQAGISNPKGPFMDQWTKAITEYDASIACVAGFVCNAGLSFA